MYARTGIHSRRASVKMGIAFSSYHDPVVAKRACQYLPASDRAASRQTREIRARGNPTGHENTARRNHKFRDGIPRRGTYTPDPSISFSYEHPIPFARAEQNLNCRHFRPDGASHPHDSVVK